MELYGKKDSSTAQKIFMTLLEIAIIWVSYRILFGGWYHRWFSSGGDGNTQRHWVLFIFNLVVFARISVTFFYLVKRHIPWAEAFDIPFAFAIYYIGYALLGYTTTAPLNAWDVFAILLFAFGSFLNTGSELMRDRWKKHPENAGQLYTGGLFKYSMHINYFGDLLWVSAYAIVTRNLWAILIPVFIFCFFAFYNIPKLDKYLAGKYGQQFEDYRQRTKKFVPFIY